MVKIMEDPIKMDDLGGAHPYFWKHPYTLSPLQIINLRLRFGRETVCLKHFSLKIQVGFCLCLTFPFKDHLSHEKRAPGSLPYIGD